MANWYKRKKIHGFTFTTSPNDSTRIGRNIQKGSKNGLSTMSSSTKNGKTRITQTFNTGLGVKRTSHTINAGTKPPRIKKAKLPKKSRSIKFSKSSRRRGVKAVHNVNYHTFYLAGLILLAILFMTWRF